MILALDNDFTQQGLFVCKKRLVQEGKGKGTRRDKGGGKQANISDQRKLTGNPLMLFNLQNKQIMDNVKSSTQYVGLPSKRVWLCRMTLEIRLGLVGKRKQTTSKTDEGEIKGDIT